MTVQIPPQFVRQPDLAGVGPLVGRGRGDENENPQEDEPLIQNGAQQQGDLEMQAVALQGEPNVPADVPAIHPQQIQGAADDDAEDDEPINLGAGGPQQNQDVADDDAEDDEPLNLEAGAPGRRYLSHAGGLITGMGAGAAFAVENDFSDHYPVLVLAPVLLAGAVGVRQGLPGAGAGIVTGVAVGEMFAHVASFVAPDSVGQARALGQVLGFGLGVRLASMY